MNIGENIKYMRNKKGLTQKELSDKLEITTRSIQNYESGNREPNIETLYKIAAALGVKINDLIEGSVINISDMTKEDREFFIYAIIENPKLEPIALLIEKQGYKIAQEVQGSDIILIKDDEIKVKVPERDFIDLGENILKHIQEFSEFELNKLIDMYQILS